MNWVRVWLWVSLWTIASGGVAADLSAGYTGSGAAAIVVMSGIAGLAAGIVTAFPLVWVSMLKVQRDEARSAYLDLQGRLDQRPALSFKHRFRLPILTIDVTVDGSTITNAVVRLVVPRTVAKVGRCGDDERPIDSGAVRWSETEIEGEEAIYWQDRNVTLEGFGTIHQFKFRLWNFGRDTGSIPFLFEIGSELLVGWARYREAIKSGAGGFEHGRLPTPD